MAPLAGEQIFTVLSTVAVQVCADATLADARRRVAARKTRREITRGPISEEKLNQIAEPTFPGHRPMGQIHYDVAPPPMPRLLIPVK
jgi:hypothetical protein